MKVEVLISAIGADFYTGVPDSYLKPLSDYLNNTYSNSRNHIIAANEGNCVAIATGYHLATQKYPVVYLQNSGEGHIINPLLSLTHEMLYAIPIIFIIGWRGEPGGHDEPQHIQQGKLTLRLLEDIGITTFVIDTNTSECELVEKMRCFRALLKEGKSVSFVVKKGALTYDKKGDYQGSTAQICREVAIRHIMNVAGESPIVSSTGKISRELFELREETGQGHERDFLTIGSMGHASSIALGLALQKNNTKVFCIDGDGSLIMHMGALAVIGEIAPNNFVHIVVNNCAHET